MPNKSFIHKKSFAITTGLPYSIQTKEGEKVIDEYDPRPDFFEVDELIAVQIQILNRKGYKTACCCAGHPFDAAVFWPVASETGKEQWVVCDYIQRGCESYVTFAEKYEFDTLPKGFTSYITGAGVTRIVREHPKDGDDWETVHSIMDAMEQLYLWASDLPDKNE